MDTPRPEGKEALVEAVTLCGGQTKLAQKLTEACGKPVSQQWVWNVINRDQAIPPEWCVPIERITREVAEAKAAPQAVITKEQLRPDIYPPIEAASAA